MKEIRHPTSDPLAAIERRIEELRSELRKWEAILEAARRNSPQPTRRDVSTFIKPGEFAHKKIIDAVASTLRRLPDPKSASIDELLEALRAGGCELSTTRNPSKELAHLKTAITFNVKDKRKKVVEFDRKKDLVTLSEE